MRRYVVSEYGIRDYGLRITGYGFGHSQIIGWNFFCEFAVFVCHFCFFFPLLQFFNFFSTNLECYILKNN